MYPIRKKGWHRKHLWFPLCFFRLKKIVWEVTKKILLQPPCGILNCFVSKWLMSVLPLYLKKKISDLSFAYSFTFSILFRTMKKNMKNKKKQTFQNNSWATFIYEYCSLIILQEPSTYGDTYFCWPHKAPPVFSKPVEKFLNTFLPHLFIIKGLGAS